MNEPQVRMVGIHKAYKIGGRALEVLRGTDFTANPGEFVALLGPSGSGKSTLLHLIAGLTAPDAGEITVCGVDYRAASDVRLVGLRRKQIGYLFQDFRLLQGLTAFENVLLPLYAVGLGKREAKARAVELMGMLGIGERAKHFPRQLSGGEQQRVALARALANRPSLLLADEPTGSLDHVNGVEIMRLLARLPAEAGTTVIAVTHNTEFADYASRVIRMRDGRLEEAGA
jgi:putative ABC transport system ATP-binding protein